MKQPRKSQRKSQAQIANPLDSLLERLEAEREAWAKRPRVGATITAEVLQVLGSEDRHSLFTALVAEYERDHGLENYVRIRRTFPELDIDPHWIGGEISNQFGKDLSPHGFDDDLLAGLADWFPPSIDETCLRLMERIVARNKLPKSGIGHIQKRKEALSDSVINYFISAILEEVHLRCPEEFPSSLCLLIRERLCGSKPDFFAAQILALEKSWVHDVAFLQFHTVGHVGSRTLAKLTGISNSKAGRWLAEWMPRFRQDPCLMINARMPPRPPMLGPHPTRKSGRSR